MNRQDLVEILATEHALSKAEAARILETVTTSIMTAVKKGDGFSLVGFGSFKKVERAARKGFNPREGKAIKIAASVVPRFTAGAKFKALVDPKGAKRKAAGKAVKSAAK